MPIRKIGIGLLFVVSRAMMLPAETVVAADVLPVTSRAPEHSTLFPMQERSVAIPANSWQRRWAVSVAPLVVSQSLDAASSYGLRELNPVLAGSDGRFGAKAVAIKFGITSALIGAEYLLVRRFPKSTKFFTVLNWTTAGVTTGLAIHNYSLPDH